MAQYTKKAILQTFQEMLEKMPFDKITVSAIVSNCEISSNTFYYHYQDIYDLLDTWLSIKKEKYRENAALGTRWQDIAKAMLHDLKSHSEIVYHLFDSLSRERIERYIFESTDDTFYRLLCRETAGAAVPEQELRAIAEYNSYSFLGFLLKFLWNRMDGDIDAGTERIGFIFESSIQWLKEKYKQE